MIFNAISDGNSFAFDSSCLEKCTESNSNGVLVYISTEILTHTLIYKAFVVAFSDLHTVLPTLNVSESLKF